MAIRTIRPMKAIGFGTKFTAETKASGIEMIAPTIVPRNAIQIVSSIKYGTPDVEKSNKNPRSGVKSHLMMFHAIVLLPSAAPVASTALQLQIISASVITAMHVL